MRNEVGTKKSGKNGKGTNRCSSVPYQSLITLKNTKLKTKVWRNETGTQTKFQKEQGRNEKTKSKEPKKGTILFLFSIKERSRNEMAFLDTERGRNAFLKSEQRFILY